MRIALSGAQCSGKTTLINEMRKHPRFEDYVFFDEVVRMLKKEKGIQVNKNADYSSQILILEKHLENLETEKFVTDRCLLDAYTYATYLMHKGLYSEKEWLDFRKLFMQGIYWYDRIYLLDSSIPFQGDGFRDTDKVFREDISKLFLNILKDFQIDFVFLEGSLQERLNVVVNL
jgi:nicotinamide riboside kinase